MRREPILERYVVREIAKPLTAVCGILVVIFASYTWARFLGDAVDGALSSGTIVSLVALRAAIALEVLLPITLFLSVVMALGRLHVDQEMIALEASGVSPARVWRAVLWLALGLAVLVAALSLFVRPWAYERSYRLRGEAAATVDMARLEAGRFYPQQSGKRLVFAERFDQAAQRMGGVFVHSEGDDWVQVVYAQSAQQRVDPATGQRILVAFDGQLYRLSRHEAPDRVISFEQIEMVLKDSDITPDYRRKAAATAVLARSTNPADVAELQWRLTTPLSTVLLALLGVPLSRATPRQGRHARFGTAVLVYAAYYNLKAMARTWLGQGVVGSVPGLWWVDALLAAAVLLALWGPWRRGRCEP